MANSNAVRKIENFEKIAENNSEKQAVSGVLENYLELSSQINMPVLKVSDLIDGSKKENAEELNVTQEITFEPDFTQINIVAMQSETEYYEQTFKAPELDLNEQSYARKLVDRIEDEVHKLLWKSQGVIRSKVREVSVRNAYSFVGYIRTVSDSGTVLDDIGKYITYSDVKHIMFCLLQQAKQAGLVNIAQYLRLRREYNNIVKLCSKTPNRKLDKRTASIMNMALENMFEEMTKVY